MTEIDERDFYLDVQRRTGLKNLANARLAAVAVVDALREVLTADEARAIAHALPDELSALVQRGSEHRSADLEQLIEGVEERANLPHEWAVENTLGVCEAIAGLLPPDAAQRLAADLPEQLRAVFRARAPGLPELHRPPPAPPRRQTLAGGKPGSLHPVSEARPGVPQRHSVAEPNPHADRKLSSAQSRARRPRARP